MAGVYHPPSVKADYDHKFAENNEQVYLLNMETILTGEFNLDYYQKDFNKHRLVKKLKDSTFIQPCLLLCAPSVILVWIMDCKH